MLFKTLECGLLHNGLTEKKVIFLQFANIERKAFTGIHIIVKHCILYSTFYGRPVFPVLFQHKYCINVPVHVYGAAVGERGRNVKVQNWTHIILKNNV